MSHHVSVLAGLALAGAAWAALPTRYPAAFTVTDRTHVGMTVWVAGRSKSMNRTWRSSAELVVEADGRFSVVNSDPDLAGFPGATGTWTPRGRSGARLQISTESRDAFRTTFLQTMAEAGLSGTLRTRFPAGGMTFTNAATRVTAFQSVRFNLRGRTSGRAFTAGGTIATRWKGTSID